MNIKNIIKSKKYNEYFFITFIFIAVNLITLFFDNFFADAGLLYLLSTKEFFEICINSGRPFHALLAIIIQPVFHYSYSLFIISTFFIRLLTTITYYSIINSIIKKDNNHIAFIITIFYTTLPICFSSSYYSIFYYNISILSFLLFFKYFNLESNFSFFKKIFLFSLLSIALQLKSLMFLCIILYLLISMYFIVSRGLNKSSILILLKRLDFLIFPIIFYIFLEIFFKAKGSFAGYNSIEILSLSEFITLYSQSIYYIFYYPIEAIKIVFTKKIITIVALIISIISIFYFKKDNLYKRINFSRKYITKNFILVFSIFVIFLSALFPYILVKKPIDLGFEDRHSILAVLVLPFFILPILNFLRIFEFVFLNKRIIKKLIILFIIIINTLFIIKKEDIYFSHLSFSLKQDAFLYFLKENSETIKKYHTFYLEDETVSSQQNIIEYLNDNILNTLAKQVFNTSDRYFGTNPNEGLKISQKIINDNIYHLINYIPNKDEVRITLKWQEKSIDNLHKVKLILLKLFLRTSYEAEIKNIYSFQLELI